ncbi:MAG: enoyl-CoA hydratase/isomerase family protein [Haloarculaceae archaeon]
MTDIDADFETIRIESPAEYVGELVLDRPDSMNTVNREMLEELGEAIDLLEADEDVRAIYVTGEGEKAFCAGADVQSTGAMDHREGVEHSRLGQQTFGRLRESDLPVVAGIDGYALGGGLELSMCADLRVASESSQLGLPEHNLGLLPGWGGTQRLQRLIGESAAKYVVFTADRLSAERMREFGFVHEVYPDDEFEERALEFAEQIAGGPPISQRYTKRAMREGWDDIDAGLEIEAQAFGHLLDSEDLAAGITAFVTDSEPEFEGK